MDEDLSLFGSQREAILAKWDELAGDSLKMSRLTTKNRQNRGKRVSGLDALFSCAKDRKAFLGLCGDRLLFCAMAAAVLLSSCGLSLELPLKRESGEA